ncbi:hypothetical protein SAM23877_5432 [Streptomyces ambofaciens ATCC 23877]|uniref:Uncharacterized protein n=1 Tax=Streptomyces ambofaciens (strain ATCC 23877 / 3486 / DSM 40053 / JCM 4204 / NBRC 12836 / NRRL B-2516) TaxID=278992 RepID=A0A0K2B049_STRA7|nr:hypothetical protein SAM23877_5432 [Streptomyces ambofaciens ATCC 23877]
MACTRSQGAYRCGRETDGMALLELRKRHRLRRVCDKEQTQCSAGVAWRTSPRTGDAASSPSAPTTASTAGTS